MNPVVQVVVGLIALFGAMFVLDTGIAMHRAKDAVTRVNMTSPAAYVGFPLIVTSLLIADIAVHGVNPVHVVEYIIVVLFAPISSALSSMYLARSMMLAQTRMDPRTVREDLREGEKHLVRPAMSPTGTVIHDTGVRDTHEHTHPDPLSSMDYDELDEYMDDIGDDTD